MFQYLLSLLPVSCVFFLASIPHSSLFVLSSLLLHSISHPFSHFALFPQRSPTSSMSPLDPPSYFLPLSPVSFSIFHFTSADLCRFFRFFFYLQPRFKRHSSASVPFFIFPLSTFSLLSVSCISLVMLPFSLHLLVLLLLLLPY